MRRQILLCFGSQLETWFRRQGASSDRPSCPENRRSVLTTRTPPKGRRGSLLKRGLPRNTTPRRGAIRLRSDAPPRVRTSLERHGKTGWYEWALRELVRYVFGIGVLGLILFVPLQMEQSWLPSNAAPVFDPAVVALFAILAIALIGTVAILAYRTMWGDDGWVQRRVAARLAASRPGKESSERPLDIQKAT